MSTENNENIENPEIQETIPSTKAVSSSEDSKLLTWFGVKQLWKKIKNKFYTKEEVDSLWLSCGGDIGKPDFIQFNSPNPDHFQYIGNITIHSESNPIDIEAIDNTYTTYKFGVQSSSQEVSIQCDIQRPSIEFTIQDGDDYDRFLLSDYSLDPSCIHDYNSHTIVSGEAVKKYINNLNALAKRNIFEIRAGEKVVVKDQPNTKIYLQNVYSDTKSCDSFCTIYVVNSPDVNVKGDNNRFEATLDNNSVNIIFHDDINNNCSIISYPLSYRSIKMS